MGKEIRMNVYEGLNEATNKKAGHPSRGCRRRGGVVMVEAGNNRETSAGLGSMFRCQGNLETSVI